MEKAFPGYQATKPLYPAVKNLWRLLGEQDSCFHTNQIAITFLENFIDNYELSKSDFIIKLAQRFNLSGGSRDWEKTTTKLAFNYIVSTYQYQEQFFKDLITQYRQFKSPSSWKQHKDVDGSKQELDPFSQVIENVRHNDHDFANLPEAKLINYYRLVRNAHMHLSEDAMGKCAAYFNKELDPLRDYFKGYYKFLPKNSTKPVAPNPPIEINHQDFVLYSRGLRYLSYIINDACDITIQDIFSEHKAQLLERCGKMLGNKDANKDITNYMKVFLRTEYSYKDDPQFSDALKNELIEYQRTRTRSNRKAG